MNVSYTYHASTLIPNGIGIIVLLSVFLLTLCGVVWNDFSYNEVTKWQIIIILILIGEPLIIRFGGSIIKEGKNQYEIQFTEANFKSYKNNELEIDESIEKIEKININFVSTGSWNCWVEYIKIEIELKEMENFQLNIRGRKWITKFLKFEDKLKKYCSEKQIPIDISFHDDLSKYSYSYLKKKLL